MLLILAAAACMAVSHISPKSIFKGLKPMIFIIILTGALNIFYTTGTPVLPGWIITWEGIIRAVKMILRIVLLITGTFLLTYTTSPMALTDGLELLMNPLKKIKVPVHDLAMMMTIALRFIPTLIEETDKIISAQKARGVDLDGGKLMDKVKAVVPIIIPLFVSAVRRASELATAMECRCYRGGEGRTKMRQLKSGAADYVSLMISILFLASVIFINAMN